MARSTTYTGKIIGFSHTGATTLDLKDISFTSGVTKASFSGTTSSGTLTVTDGTHTAKIKLIGDYLTSTFVTASDGHGGVIIHDPAASAAVPPITQAPPHQFIAAMAGLGRLGGGAIHASAAWTERAPMLVKPHAMIA